MATGATDPLTFTDVPGGLASLGIGSAPVPTAGTGFGLGEALDFLRDHGHEMTAQDLADLVHETNVGARPGETLHIPERTYTVDADGRVHIDSRSWDAARGGFVADKTPAGQLVSSPEFQARLAQLFGSATSPEALEFLGIRPAGSPGTTGPGGIWDDIDQRLARDHVGDVATPRVDTSASSTMPPAVRDAIYTNPRTADALPAVSKKFPAEESTAPGFIARHAGRLAPLTLSAKRLQSGRVVMAGETMMYIARDADDLVARAQVPPEDIAAIELGGTARVQLMGVDAAAAPEVAGVVAYVSPEPLTDTAAGTSHYAVTLEVAAADLREVRRDVRLMTGMPATAFVTTGERTALDYLLGPALDRLSHALREP